MFCPQIAENFGRPLRLKKCLYGADFSGKSWYDTLDNLLQNKWASNALELKDVYIYTERKING